jgi:ketosteroid isomerase-like protein
MTDPKAFIREWLDVTTLGPEAKWHECITDDVFMRFPYVPPQLAAEQNGREAATKVFRQVWKSFEQFEWLDVVTRKCEGEDYYVTTARSKAIRAGGIPYANEYVLLTRLRDGKVCEHIEYFNPTSVDPDHV